MKKLLLSLAVICTSGALFAQTQTLTLSDNGNYGGTNQSGTFNPNDTFTLDVSMTLTGWTAASLNATALSYWLQTNTGLGPSLQITSITYSTFHDPQSTDGPPMTFNDTSGASVGFFSDKSATESGDLGASRFATTPFNDTTKQDGTYLMTTLTFQLTNAPAGTYTLATTTLSPKVSVVGDTTFGPGHVIPEADYTINITAVPEPSTWLAGIGALSVIGYTVLRRRLAA